MASVTNSDLKRYIYGMLKDADLSTLSSKMIRRRCEEKFRADLSSRKKEVDLIVMSFVDGENSDKNDSNSDQDESDDDRSGSKSGASGSEASEKSDLDEKSDSENDRHQSTPKAKKAKKLENSTTNNKKITRVHNSVPEKPKLVAKDKKSTSDEVSEKDGSSGDDAALARQLQEEEWNLRSRSSRRPGTKRQAVKHKGKDENQGKPKVRKGTSTYTKKCLLSPELAEIMESNEMARPDIVKKMWSIVRERDLFDPSNKQFVFCDEQLHKVFGKKRVKMFSMMKYLRNHIKDKV